MSKVFSQMAMALLLAVSCFLVTGCGESSGPAVEPPAADAGGSEAVDMEKADMEKADMEKADMEKAEGSEAKEEGSGSH